MEKGMSIYIYKDRYREWKGERENHEKEILRRLLKWKRNEMKKKKERIQ